MYGFEWYIVSLLRGGKVVNEDVLEKYYSSAKEVISGWNENPKPTDAERIAITLKLAGKDITDIDGNNLNTFIYNNPRLKDNASELA